MIYGGLLGAISEMADIAKELGIPADEAAQIQRERSDARAAEAEADCPTGLLAVYLDCTGGEAPSNVIPFRAKR